MKRQERWGRPKSRPHTTIDRIKMKQRFREKSAQVGPSKGKLFEDMYWPVQNHQLGRIKKEFLQMNLEDKKVQRVKDKLDIFKEKLQIINTREIGDLFIAKQKDNGIQEVVVDQVEFFMSRVLAKSIRHKRIDITDLKVGKQFFKVFIPNILLKNQNIYQLVLKGNHLGDDGVFRLIDFLEGKLFEADYINKTNTKNGNQFAHMNFSNSKYSATSTVTKIKSAHKRLRNNSTLNAQVNEQGNIQNLFFPKNSEFSNSSKAIPKSRRLNSSICATESPPDMFRSSNFRAGSLSSNKIHSSRWATQMKLELVNPIAEELSEDTLPEFGLPDLAKLDLDSTCLTDTGFIRLFDFMTNNKSIVVLNIGNKEGFLRNKITEASAHSLKLFMQTNQALKVFKLQNLSLSTRLVESALEGLKHNQDLEILDLSFNCKLGPELGINLKKHLFEGQLRDLRLRKCGLGTRGVIALSHCLDPAYKGSLIHLDLTENHIDQKGMIFLFESLTENSRLESLVLDGNQIHSRKISSLSTFLAANLTLSSLSLKECRLDDGICDALKNGLKKNKSLRKLFLNGNYIYSKGANVLMEGLCFNSGLHELDLSYNKVSNRSDKMLKNLLIENKTLKIFNLKNNLAGDDLGKAALKGLRQNQTISSLNLKNNLMSGGMIRKVTTHLARKAKQKRFQAKAEINLQIQDLEKFNQQKVNIEQDLTQHRLLLEQNTKQMMDFEAEVVLIKHEKREITNLIESRFQNLFLNNNRIEGKTKDLDDYREQKENKHRDIMDDLKAKWEQVEENAKAHREMVQQARRLRAAQNEQHSGKMKGVQKDIRRMQHRNEMDQKNYDVLKASYLERRAVLNLVSRGNLKRTTTKSNRSNHVYSKTSQDSQFNGSSLNGSKISRNILGSKGNNLNKSVVNGKNRNKARNSKNSSIINFKKKDNQGQGKNNYKKMKTVRKPAKKKVK